MTNETEKVADHVAEVVPVGLTAIATLADAQAASIHSAGPSELLGEQGHKSLSRIQQRKFSDARQASRTPAVAHVLVKRSDKKEHQVYYVGRGTPPRHCNPPDGTLISYHSPLGRVAALLPGDATDISIPLGEIELEVVHSTRFVPMRVSPSEWDAIDVRIATLLGQIRLDSLLLRHVTDQTDPAAVDIEALFNAIENEEEDHRKQDVREEIRRRQIVQRMGLRDQPILDRYQDQVFRMPLSSHLILLGPPGTGKTTTLIHRLAQKLRHENLTEDEQDLVEEPEVRALYASQRGWAMFSPTELLSEYLRDAFNDHDVPAGRDNLRTWSALRNEIARDDLEMFGSGGRTGLILIDDSLLQDATTDGVLALYDAFSTSYSAAHDRWLADAVETIRRQAARFPESLADALLKTVSTLDGRTWRNALVRREERLRELLKQFQQEARTAVRENVRAACGLDSSLLDDGKAFLASLGDGRGNHAQRQVDPDVGDRDDDDEEEVIPDGGVDQQAALKLLMNATRALARADAGQRRPSKKTPLGAFIHEHGHRLGKPGEFIELGAQLVVLGALRRLLGGQKRHLQVIRSQYLKFRTSSGGRSFFGNQTRDGEKRNQVCQSELDVLVLASLVSVKAAFRAYRNRDNPDWLLRVARRFRDQVFIDEVTDFSAVQIASLALLSHPQIASVFACGDFDQRITADGISDERHLRWINGVAGTNFETLRIRRGYRQTSSLYRVMKCLRPDVEVENQGPEGTDRDVPAILAERLEGSELAEWLLHRVTEVRELTGFLPSIAVFVDGDSAVQELADQAGPLFEARGIPLVPCIGGRVIARNQEVRIFDIKYVKGLEFEAVFMLGLDRFEATFGALAERLVFVGLTRASRFLACTCEDGLPASLERLREGFAAASWHRD